MSKKLNVRNVTKFKRCVKAISPVIATLLMIAIAVVASLVAYAWVMGYMGSTTSKTGKSIQIQSFVPSGSNLLVYVQNVGQGSVKISSDGSVYVNDNLVTITNPAGPITIPEGQTVPLTVPLPPGYSPGDQLKIKVTTTDGTFMQATMTGSQGASNPTNPPGMFTITVIQTANGIIDPGTGFVSAGSSPTYTITPSSGYHIASIFANGISVTVNTPAGQSYQFSSVSADGSLTANYAANGGSQYTITVIATGPGTITPGTGLVNAGDTPMYTITPNDACHTVSVTANGVPQTVTNPDFGQTYTFPPVSADVTIEATFSTDIVSITWSTGGSGTGNTNPNGGPTDYVAGVQYNIVATPTGGSTFAGWSFSGTATFGDASQASTTLTFATAGTVTATFAAPSQFTITPSAGSGGSINPNTPQTVNPGDTPSFTIAATTGYHILDVTVDSVSVLGSLVGGVYTFPAVTANHNIDATFAADAVNYNIVVTQGANGVISPGATTSYAAGSTPSFTIVPASGYHIASVTTNAGAQALASPYVFPPLAADETLTATYAVDVVQYTITVTQTANGNIAPGTSSYAAGSTPTFTITPNSGYHIASITANGGAVTVTTPAGQSYQFAALSASGTLTATYAANTFGYTTQGTSTSDGDLENYILGSRFTSPAYSVTAQSITAYIIASSGTHTIKAAIYTSAGAYVMGTQEVSVTTSNDGWVTFAFASGTQPTLAASTNYYLVVWSNSASGSVDLYYTNTGGTAVWDSRTYTSWPATDTWDGTLSHIYSVYCTYSVP